MRRACLDIEWGIKALRLQTAILRHALICRKAGFKKDQPRWPQGTEGSPKPGGRWSGGAGTGPGSNEPSSNPKSYGHHFVPGEIYRKEPLRDDTRRVFESAKTGPIPGPPHNNADGHPDYNKAVKEAFKKFKVANSIARSEDMTPEQARRFVDEVRGSRDSRIRNFNMKIIMRQLRFYMRGGRIRGNE